MLSHLILALRFLVSLVLTRANEAPRWVILRSDDDPKLGRRVHVGVLGARLRFKGTNRRAAHIDLAITLRTRTEIHHRLNRSIWQKLAQHDA